MFDPPCMAAWDPVGYDPPWHQPIFLFPISVYQCHKRKSISTYTIWFVSPQVSLYHYWCRFRWVVDSPVSFRKCEYGDYLSILGHSRSKSMFLLLLCQAWGLSLRMR